MRNENGCCSRACRFGKETVPEQVNIAYGATKLSFGKIILSKYI